MTEILAIEGGGGYEKRRKIRKKKERFVDLRFRLKKKPFLPMEEKRKGIPFVSISFVSPLEEDEGREERVGHHRDISITLESISRLGRQIGKNFSEDMLPSGRREGGRGGKREDASHTRVERKERGGKERDDRHREGVSRSTNLSRIEWDRWGCY